jgi:hypothetical protein
MRLSRYFLPLLKETPAEAQIVSHQLMLRAGMIRQSSAGIYSWLPLGLRVLRKVEQIVREEMDAAGCNEVLMPTIQPCDLWQESGRLDDYGKEMLRITDRHDRPMLYGPTHEEVVTDIFRRSVKSYRDLPVQVEAGARRCRRCRIEDLPDHPDTACPTGRVINLSARSRWRLQHSRERRAGGRRQRNCLAGLILLEWRPFNRP